MSKKITTEEFSHRLYQIYGNQFDVLSEYVSNNTKIKLKCNRCGNIIYKAPVKMTGRAKEGCYICSGKNRYKDRNYLQKEVDKKYPDQFIILGEYTTSKTPILVKRITCSHVYYISPDNLLRGKGCPKCSIRQSSYMDIVESYLSNHMITYIKEARFPDCKNIRTLPFDYYLPDYNMCIEVDGEFHFNNNSKDLNLQSNYHEVSKRDNIKTAYCINNNIRLLRLPYYDKDIFTSILNQELNVNTEIT